MALKLKYNLNGSYYYVDPNKRIPRGLKRFFIFIGSLIALYLLIVAGVFFGQRRLIYFPDTSTPAPASSLVETATDISLATADGLQLGAWWAEPHTAVEPRNQVVLYAGGNAGNRGTRSQLVFFLTLRGFHVLSLDYRGYGGNPGTPSEAGLALDVRAALAEITARGFEPSQIIYFGESLGAAVVTELAVEHPPAALVLRSPFSSLANVAHWHFPWLPVNALLREHYPVETWLAEVTVPVMVIYGTSDHTVPPLESLRAAGAAPNLFLTVPFAGLGHNSPSFWGLSIAELVQTMGNLVG